MRLTIRCLVYIIVSNGLLLNVSVEQNKKIISAMALNRNNKIPLVCPNFTIIFLLLITSVVIFVGTFTMNYEFSIFFGNYFEDYLEMPVLILIAGSVMVFADAFMGIISLACKWYQGVITFLVSTICLLVAMIALVALAYGYLNTKEEAIYSRLKEDLKNNDVDMDVIDIMQFGLKCCGFNNSSDWSNGDSKNIPESCCIESGPCDTNNTSEIHSMGCYQAMSLFLCYRKWIVVVVLAVLALVEIVAIMLSVTVFRQFSREKTSGISVTDNNTEVNTGLPSIHNPLANSMSSVDNNRIYVRRPTQLPAVLNYRSPHESFLRQPPQLRFDRRVSLPISKMKNPYAVRPR